MGLDGLVIEGWNHEVHSPRIDLFLPMDGGLFSRFIPDETADHNHDGGQLSCHRPLFLQPILAGIGGCCLVVAFGAVSLQLFSRSRPKPSLVPTRLVMFLSRRRYSQCQNTRNLFHTSSDLININLLAILTASIPILIELNVVIHTLMTIRIRLVDLRALGQLSIGFQTPSFVGAVLEDHISLFVLVVAQGKEDDVALVDPDFFAEFTLFQKNNESAV